MLAEDRLVDSVTLFAGFALDLGYNSGIAFGAFTDAPPLVLITGAGVLVAALLAAVRFRLLPLPWPAVGLLIGGAVGNLIDRLDDGYVTDFIDPPHWPVFNLADIAITLALLLIWWRMWREPSGEEPNRTGMAKPPTAAP